MSDEDPFDWTTMRGALTMFLVGFAGLALIQGLAHWLLG